MLEGAITLGSVQTVKIALGDTDGMTLQVRLKPLGFDRPVGVWVLELI